MLLHTPTLFILSICVSLALAGVLAYVGFRRHPGLLLWAAGLLLN
ncbi:MAG: hypothetical protein RIS35_2694, partial [Pseudomonadota bacterium]